MRINNLLILTIINLLLLSLVPYTLSACTKVPVADEATKNKAKEDLEKATEAWIEAEKEVERVKDLIEVSNANIFVQIAATDYGFEDGIIDGVGKAKRKWKLDEAKENANKALQTYYTARAYYESVQDVETHPKYIPACGDSSHGLTMCYPDELSKQTNEYWKRWHEIRLSKCDDYEIINGIKNYCIITNFFWCQLHAHMYGEIRDSDSNSDNTPNCDDCTDGSDDCPNASSH